jgi:hypothetical protein
MFSLPTMCIPIPINTHVGQHCFSCNIILAADYWLSGEKKGTNSGTEGALPVETIQHYKTKKKN